MGRSQSCGRASGSCSKKVLKNYQKKLRVSHVRDTRVFRLFLARAASKASAPASLELLGLQQIAAGRTGEDPHHRARHRRDRGTSKRSIRRTDTSHRRPAAFKPKGKPWTGKHDDFYRAQQEVVGRPESSGKTMPCGTPASPAGRPHQKCAAGGI